MSFQVPPVRTTSVHPSDWTHPLPAIKISFYSSLEPQGYHVAKVLRSAIAALGFLVIVAIKRLGDKMVISKTHAGGIRLGLRNRKIRCRKYKVYIYIYIYIHYTWFAFDLSACKSTSRVFFGPSFPMGLKLKDNLGLRTSAGGTLKGWKDGGNFPLLCGYAGLPEGYFFNTQMQKKHPHGDLDGGGCGGGGDGSGGRFHNFLFVFLGIFCIKNLGWKCPSFVMFFPGSWPDLAIYSDSETFCNKFDSRLGIRLEPFSFILMIESNKKPWSPPVVVVVVVVVGWNHQLIAISVSRYPILYEDSFFDLPAWPNSGDWQQGPPGPLAALEVAALPPPALPALEGGKLSWVGVDGTRSQMCKGVCICI